MAHPGASRPQVLTAGGPILNHPFRVVESGGGESAARAGIDLGPVTRGARPSRLGGALELIDK